ncbi:hypothetical protein B0H63DRAFT_410784 [Podospora didyma]|uniref:Nephrocystin 3-like N-terminal domain-containing protein n=1 Tax=Podospora didyma TaxID=330526 RepID=A0AAE0U4K1_9PEZI|nr:hypothetical protein B0H63DRAFT_410784 [Podospora didyma]
METIKAGLHESLNGLSVKARKPSDAVSVSVSVVSNSSDDSSKTAEIRDDALSASHTSSLTMATSTTIRLTRLIETTRTIRGNICTLGDYNETYFKAVDLESYLEYISVERLIHMPRRGSDWDRVLKAAQFFGLQLWRLGINVGHFCPDTEAASVTALGSTQILLEIGPKQSKALIPTFQALYELAILISHVTQIHEIFRVSTEVKEIVAHLYCDLVELVGNITTVYRKKISNLSPGESLTLNFEAAFGKAMASIFKRRDSAVAKIWSLKLGNRASHLNLESIRRRLKQDRSVAGAFYDQVAESLRRADDTCEWLKAPMIEFFRSSDKALTITGDSGTGKTVLAEWMEERLQRPLDHTQYSTLTYTFPYDYPAQCTPLAFLKNVLFQLLGKSVGDVSLYESIASAFEAYDKHHNSAKLEAALWTALEAGLRTLNGRHARLTLIVDGFHEITGPQSPLEFHKALRACIGKFKTIRMITLSKAISHLSDGCRHFTITPHHLEADIKTYFRQSFSALPSYVALSPEDKKKVVQDLAHKAKSSFLWAYLAAKLLAKEPSRDAFANAAHHISGSVDDVLKQLVAKIFLKNETTQTLLSFMLAADRPFLVDELAELLRLNTKSRQFGPAVDVPKLLKSTCGDIVTIEAGSVHFKSKAVQTYMQGLMGKSLPTSKEAQGRLTLALLLYAKLSLPDSSEPSFELLGHEILDQDFHAHALLHYAVRHWQSHLRASSFYGSKGELVLTKDFHEVFPASCHFALLERSACHYGQVSSRLVEHHEFSLHVREACFGEKHISVVQTLIILGNLHVTTSDALIGAKFFYRACSLGKVVLSRFNAVVVTCLNYFLQYTETITITTRTEIVTYREEMIIFMIEVCKSKHGATHDLVIKWYEILARLYVDIKETHRASVIYKELHAIIVIRFGPKSPQARRLCEHLGGLDIVLKGDAGQTEIDEYAELIIGGYDDSNAESSFEVLLRLAIFYESSCHWHLAERIYITLWRRFSETCRIKATVHLHVTKIKIAIEYVKFLRRLKRPEEACNILVCLWAEYEFHSWEERTIIVLIKEVGVLFKACGLLHIAISVLTKVWGWFKSKGGGVTDDEAVQTSILITEVVEEITETIVSTKTTTKTTTTTEVTETVTREIFETQFTRCKKSKVDIAFFKSCLALVNLYIKLENWTQAEIIIRQSLEITWKAILTAETTTLTEHFVSECILVATRLAVCHRHQGHFEKAERIYLRIFHACLGSLHIEDVRIQESLTVLIQFYEEYHRHTEVRELWVTVIAKYRKHLGHSHKLTIQALYALAAHCELLGRSDAIDYYIEICTTLNKHSKHCHHDAFQAAIVLVRRYHERKCWTELQHICGVLWETFCHHHKDVCFTEDIIQLIYERYTYVLEFHAKVELSVLYEITVKFRETVTVVFGSSASIVIQAMLFLARICERHEKHHHESVTIYEEIIKRVKTTTTTTTTETETETTINTVKKRLSKIYVTIITKGGKTVTTTTVERAIAICLEAYAQLTIEFGCWHEHTLLKLKDIVILYQKLNIKESHTKIVELLQAAFVSISTATCGSMSLYHAATTLASIYITAGLATLGHHLVHHLRHLIIFGKDFEMSTDIVVTANTSLVSKVAFVFLVAFEQRIVEKVVVSFSELMATTLLEISLYEQYKKVFEVETKTEVILECGFKLRSFWVERKQEKMLAVLDKRLFALFKTKYGALIATHDDYSYIFYLALSGYLAKEHAKLDFAAVACKAGNAKVANLLEHGEFKKALEVAKCTFHFNHKQHFYTDLHRVQYAYKLAELLAGIDANKPTDPKLGAEFLKLSREITSEALAIFKANNIEFVRLRFEDLSGIVRLLGSQQNYGELETLLLRLWQSREVQKTWDIGRILNVGRLLVHAHVAAKNTQAAIDLAETICYNLRRSRGNLDPVTVEMSQMLAALYQIDDRLDRCILVHEDILREIDAALREDGFIQRKPEIIYQAANGNGNKSGQMLTLPAKPNLEELAKTASWQLELLKRAHLRLGRWIKPEHEFVDLHSRLQGYLGKAGLKGPAPETWTKAANKGKPDDMIGMYVGPREWEWRLDGDVLLGSDENLNHKGSHGNGVNGTTVKSRWSVNYTHVANKEWLLA